MKLHFNTVSPTLLTYLNKFMKSDIFKDFILAGGTALSLQRGHRVSIDIDLFTALPYGTMPTSEIRNFIENNFLYHTDTESLSYISLGYSLRIGDSPNSIIKVDLFYTDPFIFKPIKYDCLRIADEREIAAMKILALTSPILRQKDFWDIHDLLEDYTLSQIIEWSITRYPYELDVNTIIAAFDKIDNVSEATEGIESLKFNFWELVRMDLKDEISRYKNSIYCK